MKIMKKRTMFTMLTAAAITAAMMSSTMSASAASMADATEGVLTVDANTTEPNKLTFTKDIVIHNEKADATVYGPGITYTYEIAKAAGGATVKDSAGNVAVVKQGVDNGVTFTTNKNQAVFANTETFTMSEGKYVASKELELSIDLDQFTSAGIYRYEISESTDDNAITGASIYRDENYSDKRYLDVYIRNTTDGKLEVYGYVMFHDGASTSFDGSVSTNGNTEKKTDGYDASDDSGSGTGTQDGGDMADHYYTYNYELEKVVAGALGDKAHPFPFEITTAGYAANYKVETTGTLVSGVTDGAATVGQKVEVKLANGQNITLIGLPADVTISTKETNDTADTYKVKAVTPAIEETSKPANQTASFEAKKLTTYAAEMAKATRVAPTRNADDFGAAAAKNTFTNTLDSISPTGVVMMVAPYAIMLAAAGFFILVFLKNRRKDESAGTI